MRNVPSRSLPSIGLLGLAALAVAGCADVPATVDEVGEAAQAATGPATCITLQRGVNGVVSDALLNRAQPDKNYGASGSLTAGLTSGVERDAVLAFDLASVPPGSTITQATLDLFQLMPSGVTKPVRVHRATAPWSEATVTWNSFGGAADPAVAAQIPAVAPYNQTSADVTGLVQQWSDGTPNHGLLLERDLDGSTVYATSEGIAAQHPALGVCYVPPFCYGQPNGTACTAPGGVAGSCASGTCVPAPTCADGIQNQGEAGVDCGGPCAPCPSCSDGIQNQGEAGVDCGGPCAACPTCSDGIQNQGESGVDCGGPCPIACASCSDGIQNQGETGVDCGGPCAACPSCADGIQNQGETGVDCGGPCTPCITSAGLVLHLDASRATAGGAFPGAGCPSSSLTWTDLAPFHRNGALSHFVSTSCAASATGWQGTGVPTDPFRLVFDGSDDVVDVGTSSALDFTSGMTAEVWVNLRNPAANSMILSKFDGSYNGFYVQMYGSRVILSTRGNSWAYSSAPLSANTWYHVVATCNATTKQYYLNAAPAGTSSVSNPLVPTTAPLLVGNYNLSSSYDLVGSLADVKLYDRALTQAEVHQNCIAMQSRFAGLVCN